MTVMSDIKQAKRLTRGHAQQILRGINEKLMYLHNCAPHKTAQDVDVIRECLSRIEVVVLGRMYPVKVQVNEAPSFQSQFLARWCSAIPESTYSKGLWSSMAVEFGIPQDLWPDHPKEIQEG